MAERKPAADEGEDDTLELTEDMELDDAEAHEAEGDEEEAAAAEDEAEAEGEEETVISFEDEAEPGSAEDTPVIRRLRERVKELNKEVGDLRRDSGQRQEQELGPKPTLADFGYDEEKYEAAFDAWKEAKRQIDASGATREAEAQAAQRDWQRDMDGYAQKRDSLAMPDYEDSAEIVKSALTIPQQATIIKAANNAAAFVYGLAHSDARLAELAKIHDPIKLAAAIARMEGGLKVAKRRRTAVPDRPTRGSASLPGTTDKHLEKLEAEADKTGNRTAVIQYRKKLAQRGKK
jgi:hypothetical protein